MSISTYELINSDVLEGLKALPSSSVDLIFADPPYHLSNDGVSVSSGRFTSVNKGEWDRSKGFEEDLSFHSSWILECRRVLKPKGSIWISGTYHSIYLCGFALQHQGSDLKLPHKRSSAKVQAIPIKSGVLIISKKNKTNKMMFDANAIKLYSW